MVTTPILICIMNREVKIDRVGCEAIPEIKAVAEVAFRATYSSILTAQQIDYMMVWMYSSQSLEMQITEQQNSFFVARVNGRAVGYAAIHPENETSTVDMHVFHLEKIYILPECQGMGIGKLLLGEACSYVKCLNSGTCRVELNVNRNNSAQEFYRKMGFAVVREGDFPIGNGFFMNDYIMAKEF